MKNKLFLLFRGLTNRELKQFEEKSAYFFQKEDKAALLFNFLKTKRKKLDETAFEDLKMQAFAALFGEQDHDPSKLRKVMAVLLEQIEDFLLLQSFKKNRKRRQKALREVYQNRNWDALWLASAEQAKKQESEEKHRDTLHSKKLLELQHSLYFYPNEQGFKEKNLGEQLQEMHESLDEYYLISKLRYCCEAIAIHKLRNIKMDIPLGEWVLKCARDERLAKNPLIGIWYKLITAFENPDSALYFELKKAAFKLFPLIQEEERLHLFESLVNICWFSFHSKAGERSLEIFNLYFAAMEDDILRRNGLISPSNFINIIDIGTSIKEIDKVQLFMAQYAGFLRADEQMKMNIQLLARAFLLFSTGKFKEISKTIAYVDYDDVSYGFRAHTLLIKSLYEVKKGNGYEEIDQKCDSFKQYITRKYRKKYVSKSIRDENMNFIKIMKKLPFAQNSRHAKITKAGLHKEVSAMRVKAKGWLLEKIKEIS